MRIIGRITAQDLENQTLTIEYSYLDCENSDTVEYLIESQKRLLIQAKVSRRQSHEESLRKKFFVCLDQVIYQKWQFNAKNKKKFYEATRKEFFPLHFLSIEGENGMQSDPYFPSIMDLSQEELKFVLENFVEKWERLGIIFTSRDEE